MYHKVISHVVTPDSHRGLDDHIGELYKSVRLLEGDSWVVLHHSVIYLGEEKFCILYVLELPDHVLFDGPDLLRRALPHMQFTREEARILHGRGLMAEVFQNISVDELEERLATLRVRRIAKRLVSKRRLHDAQQEYTEEDHEAWQEFFDTRLANALIRARVPLSYVFNENVTDDDIRAIPGLGKKSASRVNYWRFRVRQDPSLLEKNDETA